MNLTNALRSCRAFEPRKRDSSKALIGGALGIALCLAAMTSAKAVTNTDYYKLYLHSKIIDFKQFNCAVEVAHRESRWNPSAHNGNHWGLFQMENKKVRYMNPYTQIDWWVRYVQHRYKGQPCLSLLHLKAKGWQ